MGLLDVGSSREMLSSVRDSLMIGRVRHVLDQIRFDFAASSASDRDLLFPCAVSSITPSAISSHHFPTITSSTPIPNGPILPLTAHFHLCC